MALPIACCFAGPTMTYGGCGQLPPATTFEELRGCWKQARAHFGNNTIVGDFNLTMAEKYNIFVIALGGDRIDVDPKTTLAFEADIFAPGAKPAFGYLPFKLQLALPSPSSIDEPCPQFALNGLSVEFSLGEYSPRTGTRPGFTFSIGGCSRERQSISNLGFRALGYGNLRLSFVTLRDSPTLLSVEPSAGTAPVAADAFSFVESILLGLHFAYLGDVTGDFGNAYGMTQNGTQAENCTFRVADPTTLHLPLPFYRFRDRNDGYSFGWYGSYPQEHADPTRGFAHLRDTSVEYLRDVSLGSVNVSGGRFFGWNSSRNPVFQGGGGRPGLGAPLFNIYNMEMSRRMSRRRRLDARDAEVVTSPRAAAGSVRPGDAAEAAERVALRVALRGPPCASWRAFAAAHPWCDAPSAGTNYSIDLDARFGPRCAEATDPAACCYVALGYGGGPEFGSSCADNCRRVRRAGSDDAYCQISSRAAFGNCFCSAVVDAPPPPPPPPPPPRPLFGSNLTGVTVEYLWAVAIERSAATRTTLRWARGPAVPPGWVDQPYAPPDFALHLESDEVYSGFPQVVRDSLACMRPALALANGSTLPPQKLTRDNRSTVERSTFAHEGDRACA